MGRLGAGGRERVTGDVDDGAEGVSLQRHGDAADSGVSHSAAQEVAFAQADGPSSTTTILGSYASALPDSNATFCVLNRQRRLTLPSPTAAPAATSLSVC